MRKNMFVAAAMVAVAFGFTACSSSKSVSGTTGNSSKKLEIMEMTKAEELAFDFDKNAVRALGIGRSSRVQNAMTAAVTNARSEFKAKTEAWVKSAAKEAFSAVEQGSSNGSEYLSVADEAFTSNQLAEQLVEGVVKNTSVIHQDKVLLPDGRVEVYVCIEYKGEIGDMINEMVETAKKRIPQQISDEERMKIQFEMQRFENSLEDEFERFREEKNK